MIQTEYDGGSQIADHCFPGSTIDPDLKPSDTLDFYSKLNNQSPLVTDAKGVV
jgi:hypothetical protein